MKTLANNSNTSNNKNNNFACLSISLGSSSIVQHGTYRIKDKSILNKKIDQAADNDLTNAVNASGSDSAANVHHNKLSKEERIRLVREKREQELLRRKREIEENLKRKQELREKQILEKKKRIGEQMFKENEKRTAAVERRRKREEMARVNF